MAKFVYVLALAATVAGYDLPKDLEGTELLFTMMIHRHGDRTPVQSTLPFSTDPVKAAELSAPYGYGQLTPIGKRRGYEVGQFIRFRYNDMLSPSYNRSEVFIRSTDSTRTKMTILTALAAIYPPGPEPWCSDIHWTPVPYTTVPPKYDYNLATFNCPTYIEAYQSLLLSQPSSMNKYNGVLNVIAENIGINITQSPVLIYSIYDTFVSQMSLGLPLNDELEKVFPEIREAAGEAIRIMAGNENYIALQAGVLLQEFYTFASKVQAGEDTPRVRIHSAHDLNVYSLIAVTQVEYSLGVPKYGSVYSLELRWSKETGQYFVVPVYLHSPGDDVIYLPVKGCGELCEYQKFVEITSKFALDVDTWREKCKFTNDLVIDDSNFA